jgi:antitoxin MazE
MTQIQQPILAWGNGLGLRITAPIAKAARLSRGTVISMEVLDDGIMIRPVDRPRQQTLAQKLKAFDPKRHGGEVMASGRVGAEVF